MVERVEENQAEKVQNWEHAFIWPAQGLTHTHTWNYLCTPGIIYPGHWKGKISMNLYVHLLVDWSVGRLVGWMVGKPGPPFRKPGRPLGRPEMTKPQ